MNYKHFIKNYFMMILYMNIAPTMAHQNSFSSVDTVPELFDPERPFSFQDAVEGHHHTDSGTEREDREKRKKEKQFALSAKENGLDIGTKIYMECHYCTSIVHIEVVQYEGEKIVCKYPDGKNYYPRDGSMEAVLEGSREALKKKGDIEEKQAQEKIDIAEQQKQKARRVHSISRNLIKTCMERWDSVSKLKRRIVELEKQQNLKKGAGKSRRRKVPLSIIFGTKLSKSKKLKKWRAMKKHKKTKKLKNIKKLKN